jgi:hypothetical protein
LPTSAACRLLRLPFRRDAWANDKVASGWVTASEREEPTDDEHLLVRFDSDGRAASAELVTD